MGWLTGHLETYEVILLLRTVISTCPPILENCIIPLTYGDASLHKAFRRSLVKFFVDKVTFNNEKVTYGDPCP
jgi:hypothetical protein